MSVVIDTSKMLKLIAEMPDLIEASLDGIAENAVGDIKEGMLNSPPTGNSYKRGSRSHVASSAGNPPRPDYGALIGSIRQRRAGRFTREILDGVEYGYYLEMIKDRPWMRPVLMIYAQGKMESMLADMLDIRV